MALKLTPPNLPKAMGKHCLKQSCEISLKRYPRYRLSLEKNWIAVGKERRRGKNFTDSFCLLHLRHHDAKESFKVVLSLRMLETKIYKMIPLTRTAKKGVKGKEKQVMPQIYHGLPEEETPRPRAPR